MVEVVVYTFSGSASPHPIRSQVESPGTAIEVPDDGELRVVEDSATHVVQVVGDEPLVVHVVEQVAVDPERFGLGLDDLVDVDVAVAAPGVVLTRHADGVWRGGSARAVPQPHVQSAPTLLVQVLHGLDYYPGGVTSVDTTGMTIEYDRITHPLPGVTELHYKTPFAGTVYLS